LKLLIVTQSVKDKIHGFAGLKISIISLPKFHWHLDSGTPIIVNN